MMRLPKPAETNVTHDRRRIGSVYTAEQMRKYAAKATEEANARANASWELMCKKMIAFEREACAKMCDEAKAGRLAEQIRARGQA